jgi:hypothetical protein
MEDDGARSLHGASIMGESHLVGILIVQAPKKSPQRVDSLGRMDRLCSVKLPAHLHGLAFAHVWKQGDLASTVNLDAKSSLVLCAQARRPLGEYLPKTIHELLELCGPLIVECELLLTYSAFSLSTMKHSLEWNLLRHVCFRLTT